jgi:hypothetical protein
MAKTPQALPNAFDAVHSVFGRHPEDVISPLETSVKVFGWLEALTGLIKEESRKERPNIFRIEELADISSYLTEDFANYIDCCHEEMKTALQVAKARGGQ